MNYFEDLVPTTPQERKKQLIIMMVLVCIPFVFTGAGYLLKPIDYFWAIFCWVGAAATASFLVIPKTIRLVKDDFYSHKVIYKGTIQEVRTVKMGYGTSSTDVYELVLEKKTLKISERELIEAKLLEVPLPVQGEEIEIHALPKSGDILKLLIYRNGSWKSVALA